MSVTHRVADTPNEPALCLSSLIHSRTSQERSHRPDLVGEDFPCKRSCLEPRIRDSSEKACERAPPRVVHSYRFTNVATNVREPLHRPRFWHADG